MAPEQMRGEQADVRADLFSFCVSLYEALYGERPFAGDTVADLQRATSENKVRPPPGGTRVPAWIHRSLLRGLRAEQDERPQTMGSLLGSLSIPRRSWLPLVVGATLALLAGIVIVVLEGSRQRSATPDSVRSIAVLPFVNPGATTETEFLSDGITESLINSLSHAPE